MFFFLDLKIKSNVRNVQARYVKFEHLLLPVPEKVEKYLNIRFGSNYMSLPSEEEKMKYPSHAYIVDTNKSYTEYIK